MNQQTQGLFGLKLRLRQKQRQKQSLERSHAKLVAVALAAALAPVVQASTPKTKPVIADKPAQQSKGLSCTKAVYRLSPPGVAVAVYFDLANTLGTDVALVSAASQVSDRVEIHKSSMEGGMMTMEQLSQVTVAKGKTVAFKPGGKHLMVFAPKKQFKVGDKVTFNLTLKDGGTWPCVTTVQKEYTH